MKGSDMRRMALTVLALALGMLAATADGFGQKTVSSTPYATPNLGGMGIETTGGIDAVVGYTRVQPSVSTAPAALSILDFTQGNVLISETGLPGMTTVMSGRSYVEVNGPVNTGVAFANTTN